MRNSVKVLVRACRVNSRHIVFRDFSNSTIFSRRLEDIKPFYAKIWNVHCAPQCADLVSRLRRCFSIALFTRKTLSTFWRLFNARSRLRMDVNFWDCSTSFYGATNFNFGARPNGAVQPPLHRTPQAVAVSASFGSSNYYEVVLSVPSEKIKFESIFVSVVAFSNL